MNLQNVARQQIIKDSGLPKIFLVLDKIYQSNEKSNSAFFFHKKYMHF